MTNSLVQKFAAFATLLRRVLGFVCAFVMAALTLSVLWGVATRYIFGAQAEFTEEAARMLLVVITFLGGAYAFGMGRTSVSIFWLSVLKARRADYVVQYLFCSRYFSLSESLRTVGAS